MPKAKSIFGMVKRLSGPNKGKSYKRYFKSESLKAEALPRYSRVKLVKPKPIPKKPKKVEEELKYLLDKQKTFQSTVNDLTQKIQQIPLSQRTGVQKQYLGAAKRVLKDINKALGILK